MVRPALALLALSWLLVAAVPPPAVVARIPAVEARQGVASDGFHVYAIDNNRIGKYRIADGAQVARWEGDKVLFPHINSCTVVGRELVCAASNYPQLPMTSSVEVFDTRSLRHLRSHSFGISEGSLTALDRHAGHWWAFFAHYDGRGGEPGKGVAHSQLVRLDDRFHPQARWTLPVSLVERMKPYSASGASWTADGKLALSGHDRAEIYLVTLPPAGSTLVFERSLDVATHGQAIDWDPRRAGHLWSISRSSRELVLSDLRAVLADD